MDKLNIRIFDDEPENIEKWRSALEGVAAVKGLCDVSGLNDEQFREGLSSVEARRRHTRDPAPDAVQGESQPNCFDETDILVIDYDLFKVGERRDLTGEEVAYLVRCFSHCKLIVALNQGYAPNSNPFHLDLRPHPQSWADLNISSKQLHNPGVWGTWNQGMRPWYWPNLIRAAGDFARCVADVAALPEDARILETLGLDEAHLAVGLSPAMLKPLVRGGTAPEDLTFARLADLRLRAKDRLWEPARSSIAVAAVRGWLDRFVLPPQNILVDAPHLITRFPSLLPEQTADAADRTTTLGSDADLTMDLDAVSTARFAGIHWLSRPVWYWHLLNDLDLPENLDPWGSPSLDAVFCEDLSRFLPRTAARRYLSGLSPEFLHRWVADPEEPQAKAILGDDRVDYDNDWLLAL